MRSTNCPYFSGSRMTTPHLRRSSSVHSRSFLRCGWEESVFELPGELVRGSIRVSLTNEGPGDFVDYHVWITQ